MAWPILACFRPQEYASATVCREMSSSVSKSLASIYSKLQLTNFNLGYGASREHSSKAGFTALNIPPYCPHGKILRTFKDE